LRQKNSYNFLSINLRMIYKRWLRLNWIKIKSNKPRLKTQLKLKKLNSKRFLRMKNQNILVSSKTYAKLLSSIQSKLKAKRVKSRKDIKRLFLNFIKSQIDWKKYWKLKIRNFHQKKLHSRNNLKLQLPNLIFKRMNN